MKTIPSKAEPQYNELPIDRTLFLKGVVATDHVTYHLGSKPPIKTSAVSIATSDCSGWARWILYYASGGAVVLVDGSQNQRVAFSASNLKKSSLPACLLHDNILRVITRKADSNGVGHIAFALNGMCYDCSSTFHGVSVHAWTGNGWMSEPANDVRIVARF